MLMDWIWSNFEIFIVEDSKHQQNEYASRFQLEKESKYNKTDFDNNYILLLCLVILISLPLLNIWNIFHWNNLQHLIHFLTLDILLQIGWKWESEVQTRLCALLLAWLVKEYFIFPNFSLSLAPCYPYEIHTLKIWLGRCRNIYNKLGLQIICAW